MQNTLGTIAYEITNYLGNVNVVISDRKIYVPATGAFKACPLSRTDYYPFGMEISSRTSTTVNYRFGYNGMEQDPEAKGEGNSYTTEFRQYDPRIGRWLSLDPLMAQFPWQSPYCAFDNNPVLLVDPTGLSTGDYYTKDGEHLGSDGKDDDLGYTVNESDVVYKNDGKTIDKEKTVGATQFTDKHREFTISANVVNHESSGDKTESLWIAHTANNAKDNNAIDWQKQNTSLYEQLTDQGYSTTPASARTPLRNTDNSSNAKNARAAVINVLSGGADPTGGAVLWDGIDFIEDGTKSNKYNEYSKVSIGVQALKSYYNFYSGKTEIFHPYTMSKNLNKGSYIDGGFNKVYNLYSKGAEGGSIFWGIMKNQDFEKGRKPPKPAPKKAAQCSPPVPACLKGSLWGQ